MSVLKRKLFGFSGLVNGIACAGFTAAITAIIATSVQTASAAPREPYGRLLPLTITAPSGAVRAGTVRSGIVVRVINNGPEAPASRLRLIIRERDHVHKGDAAELGPDSVRLEVLERGGWVPVSLGIVDGGVLGAIGAEGVGPSGHTERHRKGGLPITAGLDKSWQLRITFSHPGSYAIGAALSPDNGSRHLAQPAYTTVEVRP